MSRVGSGRNAERPHITCGKNGRSGAAPALCSACSATGCHDSSSLRSQSFPGSLSHTRNAATPPFSPGIFTGEPGRVRRQRVACT